MALSTSRRDLLSIATLAAEVHGLLLRAWRENPHKVNIALGLGAGILTVDSLMAPVDGRPPPSWVALGGALVGGIATAGFSFWFSKFAPRCHWANYFALGVGIASLFVVGYYGKFDAKVFVDFCNAIL